MADSTYTPKNCLLEVSRHSDTDTSVDIIAIHGLGTTSPLTWEAKGNQACGVQRQSVNWLKDDDMLPHLVPSARISTFTWDSDYCTHAPIVGIRDVADTLLRKLQDERDKEKTHSRPLIFIASCFGGLIVTRALEIANTGGSEYQELVVATSGVVFLGSPLQGTRAGTAAQWRAMLEGILGNSPSQTLLQDLDGHTKVLRDTSEQFLKMITHPPMQTMTMCFWESKKSQLAKAILPTWMSRYSTNTEIILVEEDSACFFGRPKQQLDASHVMMNKFLGPEDEHFKLVSGSIQRMVEEAKRITVAQREAVNIHNEYFMVSRRVNSVFTGREKEIKNLQQSLCPSYSTKLQVTGPKIYVIHGLGGAGKSEVALKFAYDNRAEFWGVFWLDASSESSLNSGFVDIAKKCNLYDKSFEGGKSWLQETNHSWLLVLDNADDPTLDYSLYLPTASKGHVLITSRVPKCATLHTAGKDYYESLIKETAVELLLKTSETDSSLYSTHNEIARSIVELLGCHALAIVQAGASINHGICDLEEYAQMFKNQRRQLLKIHPDIAKSRYGDVYTTFEVSATYLSARSDQAALDALRLLNFYAFLSFTSFPEIVFEEAWRNSREVPRDSEPSRIDYLSHWHVGHLPSFMRQGSSENLDIISLRQARSLLASLSIVVVDLPTRMTRMHPVTHMWAKDRLKSQQELRDAWLGTLAVLCLSIKDRSEQDASRAQLQPHIELTTDFPPGEHVHPDACHLRQAFYRLCYFLHGLRADKAATEMFQEYFITADQSWTTLPYAHHIHHLYGRCLLRYGDRQEAKQLLERVVRVREDALSPEHSAVLASKHSLAQAYSDIGEINKARDLLEQVVKIKAETLRPAHPDRLASNHELARMYLTLQEYDKAKNLLEQVVKTEAEILRPEHPDRLASQHQLAQVYFALENNNEAKDLLEQVVKKRAGTFRSEHPHLLASKHDLARVYLSLEKHDEAKDLLEQVVQTGAETFRPEHPDHLTSQHELANVYLNLKENHKARDLLEKIVKVEAKTLFPEDPSRLNSKHVLARAHLAAEEPSKAKDQLEEIVKIEETSLGSENPEGLVSKHALARAYFAMGEKIKAKDKLEEVVRIAEKTLVPEDPSRLIYKHALARAYLTTGEIIKAKHQIQEVVRIASKISDSKYRHLRAARKLLEECEERLRLDEID